MKTSTVLRYRLWLLFGGRRIESGFHHLAKSIEENRKLISELRCSNSELESRVWELEQHSSSETMAMVGDKLEEWGRVGKVMPLPDVNDVERARQDAHDGRGTTIDDILTEAEANG